MLKTIMSVAGSMVFFFLFCTILSTDYWVIGGSLIFGAAFGLYVDYMNSRGYNGDSKVPV